MNKSLYSMLTPILYVKDVESEKKFYQKLGFKISYDGETISSGERFSNFVGIKYNDCIEFGLEQKENFDVEVAKDNFFWQISSNSLKTVLKKCKRNNLKVIQKPKLVVKDWGLWEIKVKSPNGYEVTFEGPRDF